MNKQKIAFVCVMHKCKNCSRNSFDVINNFIKSLYKYCKRDFILYLFDNGSDEKYNVPNYSNIKYEYIENQFEFGLIKPINDGIKKAVKDNCDIIILVNDDIVFNETINKFIDIIENHEYKDISLFGPLTNGVVKNSGYQEAQKTGEGIREITYEKGFLGILNGFMMAFTREFYQKFKLSNGDITNKHKWGGGESDIHKRIKPLGARMFIINECWVFHHKFREWRKVQRCRK